MDNSFPTPVRNLGIPKDNHNIDFFKGFINLDKFPNLLSLSVEDKLIGLGGWTETGDDSCLIFIHFIVEYHFSVDQKNFIQDIENEIFSNLPMVNNLSICVDDESWVGFYKSLGWLVSSREKDGQLTKTILKKTKL